MQPVTSQLPVVCYPCVPLAFSHASIRIFPGTLLENMVVGNSGLQTGGGRSLSRYDPSLIQLDRDQTLGCRKTRMK